MSTIALLTLNGHSYDVRLLNQSFNLPVSWNGFPKQSLAGDGQLRVAMDTPADNFILELMMNTEENPIAEGQLEIYDGTDDMPFRCIKFGKAYITEFRETFDVLNGGEMTTYVQISPMEMTINKRLDIERRFFWLWSKALKVENSVKSLPIGVDDKEIIDIYWTYGKEQIPIENVSRFYVDMNLHIKTKGYNVGESLSITIKRDDNLPIFSTEPSITITGKVDENGNVILSNILKDYTLNLD
ncbi:type VI secretion system tube protein TssD [Prevotella koreensis]